ncbi:MAG: hypothetical protein LRY36_01675 [Alphaproteobacteria bacterium]|nr:hypothetical protein [Alphaproteobacteria bacterium]MCD8566626.1 hypothetical protein [Alphaproteobacteria bacterium]
MSSAKSEIASIGRGIGRAVIPLVTSISGIWAYVATPSFTGAQGVLAATMVGGGTSTVAGLYALGGGVAGAAFGAATGALAGKGAGKGAVVGAVIGAVGGGIYGIPQGYHYSHDIAVNGMASKQPQNDASSRVNFETPGYDMGR